MEQNRNRSTQYALLILFTKVQKQINRERVFSSKGAGKIEHTQTKKWNFDLNLILYTKINKIEYRPCVVVYACNPSYLGD
jgi:hypothetical protein